MATPTVYSGAQFGGGNDVSATGLYMGSVSFDGQSEQATVPDHIGTTVGAAIYNPTKEVSIDGVIAAKGTGLVGSIGTAITLANTSHSGTSSSGRTRTTEGLGVTATAGSSIIITGNNIAPSNTAFETGSLSGTFWPGFSAAAPYTPT